MVAFNAHMEKRSAESDSYALVCQYLEDFTAVRGLLHVARDTTYRTGYVERLAAAFQDVLYLFARCDRPMYIRVISASVRVLQSLHHTHPESFQALDSGMDVSFQETNNPYSATFPDRALEQGPNKFAKSQQLLRHIISNPTLLKAWAAALPLGQATRKKLTALQPPVEHTRSGKASVVGVHQRDKNAASGVRALTESLKRRQNPVALTRDELSNMFTNVLASEKSRRCLREARGKVIEFVKTFYEARLPGPVRTPVAIAMDVVALDDTSTEGVMEGESETVVTAASQEHGVLLPTEASTSSGGPPVLGDVTALTATTEEGACVEQVQLTMWEPGMGLLKLTRPCVDSKQKKKAASADKAGAKKDQTKFRVAGAAYVAQQDDKDAAKKELAKYELATTPPAVNTGRKFSASQKHKLVAPLLGVDPPQATRINIPGERCATVVDLMECAHRLPTRDDRYRDFRGYFAILYEGVLKQADNDGSGKVGVAPDLYPADSLKAWCVEEERGGVGPIQYAGLTLDSAIPRSGMDDILASSENKRQFVRMFADFLKEYPNKGHPSVREVVVLNESGLRVQYNADGIPQSDIHYVPVAYKCPEADFAFCTAGMYFINSFSPPQEAHTETDTPAPTGLVHFHSRDTDVVVGLLAMLGLEETRVTLALSCSAKYVNVDLSLVAARLESEHRGMVQCLIAMHALTGTDITKTVFGVGKKKGLEALYYLASLDDNMPLDHLALLGNEACLKSPSLCEGEAHYRLRDDVLSAVERFILACYKDHTHSSVVDRRVVDIAILDRDLRKSPSGPDVQELRGLQAHHYASLWFHAKYSAAQDPPSPLGFGYEHDEDTGFKLCHSRLKPGPPGMMALLAGQGKPGCGCKVCGCKSGNCKCFKAGKPCGEDCRCVNCQNPHGVQPTLALEAAVIQQERAEAEVEGAEVGTLCPSDEDTEEGEEDCVEGAAEQMDVDGASSGDVEGHAHNAPEQAAVALMTFVASTDEAESEEEGDSGSDVDVVMDEDEDES